MHPFVGPEAEAMTLYVDQIGLLERFQKRQSMVIWDIGLGAGANILSAFLRLSASKGEVTAVSFDHSLAPLRLTWGKPEYMPNLSVFREATGQVLEKGRHVWQQGELKIDWRVVETDFPSYLETLSLETFPLPDVIFFDAYSPAKNPEMWAARVFERLYDFVRDRECVMVTYSRSAMVRTAMLLAGFYVGCGQATGMKEETTLAATRLDLLSKPLEASWIKRVERSTAAEPLRTKDYRRSPLSPETLARIKAHPQFAGLI